MATNESTDVLETPAGQPDPSQSATDPTGGQSSAPADSQSSPDEKAGAGDVLDTKDENEAQGTSDGDVLSDDDATGEEGVPDQYTLDFEKLGISETELREGVLDEFQSKAKELGLTQKQFQGLAEYDIERTQAAESEAVDAWNERVSGWREAARTDKEFGGESYEANVKTAMQALDKFGDNDLKALLKSPSEDNPEGLAVGNHPAVLRFLNRVGKALGDPDLVMGEDVQRTDDTEARLRRLYPSMYDESA